MKMPVISPTLCLYHGNCTDGYAAAWAVWKRFGDACTYIPCAYQTTLPDVTGHDVLLVDFSFKKEDIEAMLPLAKSITILDHHKSAEDELSSLLTSNGGSLHGYFQQNHSGAVMAWNHFHDEAVPTALLHVEDGDLFKNLLPDTKYITKALMSREHDFYVWDNAITMCENSAGKTTLITEGKAIIRSEDKIIAETIASGARDIILDGYIVKAVNIPNAMATAAGNILAQDQPFGVTYCDMKNGRKYSLRSRQDSTINLIDIAKRFGGGGHFHAAGFVVDAKMTMEELA